MKFYATSLKYNRVVELFYDECTESWSEPNLFNEATMKSNSVKLEPYGSALHADKSAFEEDYHWKII